MACQDQEDPGPGALGEQIMKISWKAFAPFVVAIIVALIPPPAELPQFAWWYFAIFAGVIVGLMFEPLPGGAIGLIGVCVVTVLANHVYLSPEEVAKAGSHWTGEAIRWGLSGFANTTVWLIFGAFMFALGYEKTGLGRRIALILVRAMGRKTLTLGYAVLASDLILAPFTPSNTARSGGTIFPIIKYLPPLYDSKPNDPSARRSAAISCGRRSPPPASRVRCSYQPGAEPARHGAGTEDRQRRDQLDAVVDRLRPGRDLLLIAVPLLTYWFYPPEVKSGEEVPRWAGSELQKMGPITRNEIILAILCSSRCCRGSSAVRTSTRRRRPCRHRADALTRVVTWDNVVANKAAWNMLAWSRPWSRWPTASTRRVREVARQRDGGAHGRVLAAGEWWSWSWPSASCTTCSPASPPT